jgi:hypothetical protein
MMFFFKKQKKSTHHHHHHVTNDKHTRTDLTELKDLKQDKQGKGRKQLEITGMGGVGKNRLSLIKTKQYCPILPYP